jgi:hypothetical protein
MTLREYVDQTVQSLDENDLAKVAEYVAFLRFHSRSSPVINFDPKEAVALYAEAADEDRSLAETGMEDYARGLASEDVS